VRRAALLASSVALAAGAVATGLAAPRRAATGASALGGVRPLAASALFLRAEALRRAGRHEDVAALYRRILDLEPSSEAAVDFLAATEAYDLRAAAPTADDRVRWFRSALDLLESGIERHPDSPRLHWRVADLLVHVPDGDPAVAADLAAAGRDRLGEALLHLLVAVRETGSLGRLGPEHLDDMVRVAPRVAAERLAEGRPGVDEALAAGDETIRRRRAELAAFDPSIVVDVSALDWLEAGLAVVRKVGRRLRESPPRTEEARGLLEAYEAALGEDHVSRALRRLLPP
jgi:hypothetical protein